jgi:hypothetical protein
LKVWGWNTAAKYNRYVITDPTVFKTLARASEPHEVSEMTSAAGADQALGGGQCAVAAHCSGDGLGTGVKRQGKLTPLRH